MPVRNPEQSANKRNMTVTEQDIHDTAIAMLAEARNEGDAGLEAVAQVIANRSSANGNSPSETTRQWGWDNRDDGTRVAVAQFSYHTENTAGNLDVVNTFAAGGPHHDEYQNAAQIATEVFNGSRPDKTGAGGATFYYNPAVSNPGWASVFDHLVTIGNHKFYGGTRAMQDVLGYLKNGLKAYPITEIPQRAMNWITGLFEANPPAPVRPSASVAEAARLGDEVTGAAPIPGAPTPGAGSLFAGSPEAFGSIPRPSVPLSMGEMFAGSPEMPSQAPGAQVPASSYDEIPQMIGGYGNVPQPRPGIPTPNARPTFAPSRGAPPLPAPGSAGPAIPGAPTPNARPTFAPSRGAPPLPAPGSGGGASMPQDRMDALDAFIRGAPQIPTPNGSYFKDITAPADIRYPDDIRDVLSPDALREWQRSIFEPIEGRGPASGFQGGFGSPVSPEAFPSSREGARDPAPFSSGTGEGGAFRDSPAPSSASANRAPTPNGSYFEDITPSAAALSNRAPTSNGSYFTDITAPTLDIAPTPSFPSGTGEGGAFRDSPAPTPRQSVTPAVAPAMSLENRNAALYGPTAMPAPPDLDNVYEISNYLMGGSTAGPAPTNPTPTPSMVTARPGQAPQAAPVAPVPANTTVVPKSDKAKEPKNWLGKGIGAGIGTALLGPVFGPPAGAWVGNKAQNAIRAGNYSMPGFNNGGAGGMFGSPYTTQNTTYRTGGTNPVSGRAYSSRTDNATGHNIVSYERSDGSVNSVDMDQWAVSSR